MLGYLLGFLLKGRVLLAVPAGNDCLGFGWERAKHFPVLLRPTTRWLDPLMGQLLALFCGLGVGFVGVVLLFLSGGRIIRSRQRVFSTRLLLFRRAILR